MEGMTLAMCHRKLLRVAAFLAAAWCTVAHPQTAGPIEDNRQAIERALDLTRVQRVTVQRGLALLGFEVGPFDGIFGRRTRAAIRRWQASNADPATGYLDTDAANRLLAAGWRALARSDPAKGLRSIKYRARIAAAESLDDRRRATALLAIVLEQAAVGDLPDAFGTAQRIRRAYLRSYALTSVAKHQAGAGDLQGATRSLSEALAAARTIVDAADRALALSRTDEALAAIGQLRERPPRSLPVQPAGAAERALR